MKNNNRLLLAAAIFFGLIAGLQLNASANTLQLYVNADSHNFGPWIGGEFNAVSATLNPVTMGYASVATPFAGFETFCLETHEDFTSGSTYTYAISEAAIQGGTSTSDPISLGTAWLYSNFAKGTLVGLTSTNTADPYAYSTGDRNTDAGELQTAFWWLEQEKDSTNVTYSYDANNPFEHAVFAHFGNAAAAMADNNGFYRVGVMNLWVNSDHTGYAQDQLTLVPDGGTTAMLLGFGLLGLFLVKRRLTQQHPVKA
jgi:hypothetical protein